MFLTGEPTFPQLALSSFASFPKTTFITTLTKKKWLLCVDGEKKTEREEQCVMFTVALKKGGERTILGSTVPGCQDYKKDFQNVQGLI